MKLKVRKHKMSNIKEKIYINSRKLPLQSTIRVYLYAAMKWRTVVKCFTDMIKSLNIKMTIIMIRSKKENRRISHIFFKCKEGE